MLENWLHAVKPDDILTSPLAPYQLGSRLLYSDESIPDLRKIRVALLGVGAIDANAIRQALYTMAFAFEGLSIADLGNLKKKDPDFVIPVLKELIENGVIPILISADPAHLVALYKAFQHQKNKSLVVIDNKAPFYTHTSVDHPLLYLNGLVHNPEAGLFHLGVVGAQTHLTPPEVFDWIEQRHFDCVRLGKARTDIAEVEPIVREADLLGVHLGALRQLEAPAVPTASPSGFYMEELCQIARYAGMSDKLKAFSVIGFREKGDFRKQTAQVAAQLVWYFLEGLFQRKNDYPVSNEGLVEYIVDFKNQEFQIVFWKSQRSNRWWMQIPAKTSKKNQRHYLVPCSYNDYKQACQEELPDRLLHAIRRYSG